MCCVSTARRSFLVKTSLHTKLRHVQRSRTLVSIAVIPPSSMTSERTTGSSAPSFLSPVHTSVERDPNVRASRFMLRKSVCWSLYSAIFSTLVVRWRYPDETWPIIWRITSLITWPWCPSNTERKLAHWKKRTNLYRKNVLIWRGRTNVCSPSWLVLMAQLKTWHL